MSENKHDSFQALGKVLSKLKEVLEQNPKADSPLIDASIQRFEFCIELFWKVFKKIANKEGLEAKTPKQALQNAFQMKLIDNEAIWLNMLEDRNQSSHTYNEELALKIYSNISDYYTEMQKVYDSLPEN